MIQPTLALNFARTRQLDQRVNFSRSSTGVYTGYDGILRYAGINEPRFDHDASGNNLGLLIEEQRTNLLNYGEQFDNDFWQKNRSSISANTTTAPDGTLNADKLVESTDSNNTHYVRRAYGSNTPYTLSVYAKAAERGWVHLSSNTNSGSFPRAYFDLVNGLVGTALNGASASIEAAGNGWYRCCIYTGTLSSTVTYWDVQIAISDNALLYTGDGTSGIYLWGAQAEHASTPSSYTPTTSAAVTRTADSAEISGDPFATWIHTEGTLLAKYRDGGWLYNDTPPTDSLDLTKYIDDYSTSAAGDTIERVLFYPRTLTAAQRGRIML